MNLDEPRALLTDVLAMMDAGLTEDQRYGLRLRIVDWLLRTKPNPSETPQSG